MPIVEGAMIGGRLLPEKEFKTLIKELLVNQENYNNIKRIIKNIEKNTKEITLEGKSLKKAKNIEKAYDYLEELQVEILKNPTISLMIITNLDDENGNYKWYYEKSERQVIDKNVINSIAMVNYIKKKLKKIQLNEEISKAFSQHLQNFINYVENTSLDDEEIKKYFGESKLNAIKEEEKKKQGANAHDSRKLAYILYGGKKTFKGNITDAYIQHLGQYHKEVFEQFISKEENMQIKLYDFKKSVLEEEGINNFYSLLNNSTNNTKWFTGGDYILLDKNYKILRNIQIKSSTSLEGSNQALSYSDLNEAVNKLKILLDRGISGEHENYSGEYLDNLADKFYETFKTSGITEKVENQINKNILNLVRKELKLPILDK